MTKISELEKILFDQTASEDLYVTVNIAQGENGTKNITRAELVKSIQLEPFSDINITGGNITNTTLSDFRMTGISEITSIDNPDEFIVRDSLTGDTVRISFENLTSEFSDQLQKSNKVYVHSGAAESGTGSYMKPFKTLEEAVSYANLSEIPVAISVLPGDYYTEGNLSLPDNCSVVATNGQYATNIYLYDSTNGDPEDWFLYDPIEENCFLVGSGCYIQGFSFRNMRVDDFDNPSKGFAIAFRPGATIVRSPYIRDCSQVSNYNARSVAAPLDPENANPLVGRGGGVLLADRAILNQNSIFPYMLAFGATPRSPNGIGYVAKNGAGINGIGSITIFQRCAFYALNGGQITLNNSGTQFGDISMRSKGSTFVVEPNEITGNDLSSIVTAGALAAAIDTNRQTIIDNMWTDVDALYNVNEELTRRDANNFIQAIYYDTISGGQTSTRNFVAGFFDYKGDHVFTVFNPQDANTVYLGSVDNVLNLPAASSVAPNSAYIVYNPLSSPINIYDGDIYVSDGSVWTNTIPNDTTLLDSFIYAFEVMRDDIKALTANSTEQAMIDLLVNNIVIGTLINPSKLLFGSLIESLAHQFNLAGAGVNKNALPLNFRRVGKPLAASGSVLKENNGRVRWSGADELNNQYFAGGLKINGRTGRLEGRPFTSSVRRLARRAANSRTF